MINITAAIFVFYTATIFYIAIRAYTNTHDHADFLLANRHLPGWLAALSAGASDMSGWLLLGLPGLAFVAHQEAFWIAIGLGCGTYLNWRLVASRLHAQSTRHRDSLTLPSYFANRYPDSAQLLRVTSAIMILIFYVIYLSAGMVAAAKLFVAIFAMPYWSALLVSAVVVISYTMLGGFKAVVNTDALQATLMIGALAAASLMLFAGVEQYPTVTHELLDNDSKLGFIAIVSALAWGLGYPGQPHILARFMATRDAEHIRGATKIAVSWTLICLSSALAIGILAGAHPLLADYDGDAEKIFIVATQLLFHPAIAGLITAAILAAIMSTADSQLIIAASALYYDLASDRGHAQSQRAWLFGIRIVTLGLGCLSVFFALEPDSSVLGLVAYAWAGFGASFGPAVLISLWTERVSGRPIFFGMVAGAATVVVFESYAVGSGELYSMIPGFTLNILVVTLLHAISSAKTG